MSLTLVAISPTLFIAHKRHTEITFYSHVLEDKNETCWHDDESWSVMLTCSVVAWILFLTEDLYYSYRFLRTVSTLSLDSGSLTTMKSGKSMRPNTWSAGMEAHAHPRRWWAWPLANASMSLTLGGIGMKGWSDQETRQRQRSPLRLLFCAASH